MHACMGCMFEHAMHITCGGTWEGQRGLCFHSIIRQLLSASGAAAYGRPAPRKSGWWPTCECMRDGGVNACKTEV